MGETNTETPATLGQVSFAITGSLWPSGGVRPTMVGGRTDGAPRKSGENAGEEGPGAAKPGPSAAETR